MASELLKNKALIQRLKEPAVPDVNFNLGDSAIESLIEPDVLPQPKPTELFEERERVRKERLSDTLLELEPVLMDESVDFIERQNFAEKAIVKNRKMVTKLSKPLTAEQKEILEDVYGVRTFEAAKKKFGNIVALDIINRIRGGQVYKGMQSPIVKGFGPGMQIPTEQSPKAKKIITAALNKLKVIKNKRAFFDYTEGS